jgi:hypothetical protein
LRHFGGLSVDETAEFLDVADHGQTTLGVRARGCIARWRRPTRGNTARDDRRDRLGRDRDHLRRGDRNCRLASGRLLDARCAIGRRAYGNRLLLASHDAADGFLDGPAIATDLGRAIASVCFGSSAKSAAAA